MRRFVTLALLVLSCALARAADHLAAYNGSCQQGGSPVTTNGITSGQPVELSYPSCTIQVFLHGTITNATLFSDAGGTIPLANPFTASATTGRFQFYSADGRYDVQLTGSVLPPPLVSLQTFVISDIGLCFSCVGGTGTVTSSGSPVAGNIAQFTTATNIAPAAAAQIIALWSGTCSISTFLRGDGTCAAAGGSGSINNGTANSQVPTWSVGGSVWQPQNKPIYDVRDWATCNTAPGTSTGTDSTAGIATMLAAIGSTQATVRIIGTTSASNTCLVDTISWPTNVTLDFSGGGGFTLVSTITPPGGGAVDGTPVGSFNGGTSSCSVTLTVPTAGDAIALFTTYHFASGGGLGLPTDTRNNIYRLVSSSNADPNHYSTNTFGWVASNVPAGSTTITIPYTASPNNTCGAVAISGLGPSVGADGTGASCQNSCNTNSPMSTVAAATFTAGSFLVSFGGQTTNTEVCTQGAGFTQILNVGSGMSLCAQVQASAAGGSVTPTQAISSTPTSSIWMYNVMGLKPVLATQFVQGGVENPTNRQVFWQAGPGQIDFTGNTAAFVVPPEWWGASNAASASTNTSALQAAINAAFGIGRTNASGLSKFNKTLYLNANYNINNELQWYSVNNFVVQCNGRLHGGITQTATNKRIMDSQSMAYGQFYGCNWSSSASSTNALLDIDYNGVTTVGDFAPQFLDFYSNTFNGNGIVDVGVLGAKSGGGAQFSNITFYDSNWIGFTGAGLQAGGNGIGRNAGRSYAENALDISVFNGDFQNCPTYGIATYGAGYVETHTTSFECVSPWASYLTSVATAVDQYCEGAQGPCIMDHVRSEDLRLINSNNLKVNDSQNIDQSSAFYSPVTCLAGSTLPLNYFLHGSDLGGDGALRQITVHGTAFGGYCLFHVSSSSSTTVTDTDQTVAGAVTIGTPVFNEVMTQATTGSTGTLVVVPASIGTIIGSVTSGTIGANHTMTQATTSVTCTSQNAPTGTQSLLCNNFSGTADSSHIWTDGTTSGQYTPSAAPVFTASNPSMLITAATGSPDNSHDWVGGTSGAHYTPTGVPVNEVNWTTNVFATSVPAQQQVTFWGSTGAANICGPITANTATQITFTSCTSNYYNVHTLVTDNTSAAIVEPFWSANPTQSGDFTWAKINPEIIGGDNASSGNASGDCTINDVQASAGQILCFGNEGPFTYIKNLSVTRPDWYVTPGFPFSDAVVSGQVNGVKLQRVYGSSAGAGTAPLWSVGGRNGNTNFFAGYPLYTHMGTSPTVVSCGENGGGTSCNDVAYGMRSDQNATNDTFRNRFEVCTAWSGNACNGSVIGPPAPHGYNLTNQPGVKEIIAGGSSTGSGTPGVVCLDLGSVGSSGATVNSGTDQWCLDTSGNLNAQGGQGLTIGSTGSTTNSANGSTTVNAPSACETTFGITTLSTGGTTTDTGLTCLPANAVIDAVVYRITTTITTAASFTIGDASTGNRFCTTQSTLTAGTTGVCLAQSGSAAQVQTSAAKVRVTTNANPGAGAIRLIVYYHTFAAPSS